MASRYYGINRGQNETSVVQGSSTNSKNLEAVVNLAVSLTKSEVVHALEYIRNKIISMDFLSPGAYASVRWGINRGETETGVAYDYGTKSTVDIQDITFTAKKGGTAGDSITLTFDDPEEASSALDVSVSGTDITVSLATDDGTASSLEVGDLTFTAVAKGEDGDNLTIALVDGGTAGSETVDIVDGVNVVINMDDGVSTATQIAAAFNACAPALTLMTVAITGTAAQAQAAAAEDNLAGGADYNLISTGLQVVSAVNADTEAAALVTASAGDSDVLTAESQTPLASGAAATNTDGVYLWLDVTAGMTKHEILMGLDHIKNYIVKNNWAPA